MNKVVKRLLGNKILVGQSYRGQRHGMGWLAMLLTLLPLVAQPTPLSKLFDDSQSPNYQPPKPEELRQAEYLFRQAFTDATRSEQRAAWAALGFQVERVTEQQKVFTVIREQPKQRQGRGFYVFAAAASGAPILQAPHALNDEYTGDIAIQLLTTGPFIAGAWSTTTRRHKDDDTETVTTSDLAHQSESYFMAFNRAAAHAQPASAILQLHGFSNSKRKTDPGRTASIIVSAGQREPTPAVEQTIRCLRGALTGSVLLYPQDTNELGALTNETGELLRTLGRSSFVHIEMAQPLRERLHTDAGLRQRFGACLVRVRP